MGYSYLLCSLTQHVLECDGAALLTYLQRRIASTKHPADTLVDYLMKVDEAAQCLDEQDRNEIKHEKRTAHDEQK